MKAPVGFANLCGRVSLLLCLFIVVLQPASAFDDPPITCGPAKLRGRPGFFPARRGDGLGLGHRELAHDCGR